MKIAPRDTDNYVKNPDAKHLAALVYGPDFGQVAAIAQKIAEKITPDLKDPFNVCELNEEEILEDPARLYSELGAISMMGDKRLIFLKDIGNKAGEIVAKAKEELNEQSFLLVTARELKPDSKLRKFFEKEANVASVACYKQEDYKLAGAIKTELQKHDFRYDASVMRYLQQNLGNDYGVTVAEINKLDLYMGEERNLTLEVVAEVIGANDEMVNFDLPTHILGGDIKSTSKLLKSMFNSGVNPVTIIRMLLNHMNRLHQVSAEISAGAQVDEAMKSLRPPVFFKQADIFKGHIRKLKLKSIANLINHLIKLEVMLKSGANNPESLCAAHLENLAIRFSGVKV